MADTDTNLRGWEQHIRTGIQTLLLAVMFWVGAKVAAGAEALARLDAQVASLARQVEQANTLNRSEVSRLERRIDTNDERIRRVEARPQ